MAMAAQLKRFWKGPEFLCPGPGEGGEERGTLCEVEMRQPPAPGWSEVRGRLCPSLRETGPDRALT